MRRAGIERILVSSVLATISSALAAAGKYADATAYYVVGRTSVLGNGFRRDRFGKGSEPRTPKRSAPVQ